MCDFISGWGAGIVGVLVGHPMDTIKVNQQTQGLRPLHCVREIYQQFGLRGYFRGATFPVIAHGAINSLLFGVYRTTFDALSSIDQSHTSRQYGVNYWHCYIAGAAGGCATLSISCPTDLIKIKLQTQAVSTRGGLLQLLRKTWKSNGIRGFYQGNASMAFRDVPSYGAYMVMYEYLANWAKSGALSENETAQSVGLFAAGGVAGTVAWWLILPIDAVKSRLQADDAVRSKYKGILHCAGCIYAEQGVPGFFRGFWALSLRAFPVNGAIFLSLEWLNYLCRIMR